MMLDVGLTEELSNIYEQLNSKEEMLSRSQLNNYYEAFNIAVLEYRSSWRSKW